jgi:hypothetical protein
MDSKGKPQTSIRLRTGSLNERTEFDSFVFDEHRHVRRSDLSKRSGIGAVEIGKPPVIHRDAARFARAASEEGVSRA